MKKYLEFRSNFCLPGPRETIVLVKHHGSDIHALETRIALEGAAEGEGQLIEVPHDGLWETERGAEEEGEGGESAGEVEGAEVEHADRN